MSPVMLSEFRLVLMRNCSHLQYNGDLTVMLYRLCPPLAHIMFLPQSILFLCMARWHHW